ncbi:SDR family oxidoreductase [Photobacterium angustum]|uniref:SDR family oxidoreductase n=1 Tax=Photobacterium angustum TaxID=661 RepID=UPI0005DE31A1|nr:SDR family oxidoreductase [Photobacterium angustum]KJG18117.1 oxidoreductase [Photobacterium angustum]KJG26208.1 oxidoreductase [Photobacterium angustum]KJG32219.1 oxidoreductase [Photobacterium angustum]PSW93628.1 short-chain dehydrogenase [Photobacterium angustum]PSX02339.1 short-chain dehydrogenase [Photobacterium angustum]
MTQSILITGCSSGIGYYCAKTLTEQGFNVVASCRKSEDVERLNQEGIRCVQLDVTSESSITEGLSQALAITDGKIDVLFNNAAYGQPGALEDLPTSALREQFEANFFGWHEITKQVIPLMLAQGYGKIVQNSSVLGLVAMKYRGAYNASKFAIEGYTDTLRLELENTPISISLIEPGPIESQFRANAKRMFERHIDMNNSRHYDNYQDTLSRLGKEEVTNKFTLKPDAVLRPLLDIINSSRPKSRYYVTQPTYVFGFLRRILPTSTLDKLLIKSN